MLLCWMCVCEGVGRCSCAARVCVKGWGGAACVCVKGWGGALVLHVCV